MTAISINLNNLIKLTNDQFYQLCRDNPNVKFERNAKGELIVMPPTGGKLENAMPSLLHGLWCGTNKPNLEKYSTPLLALNFLTTPTVPLMYPGYS